MERPEHPDAVVVRVDGAVPLPEGVARAGQRVRWLPGLGGGALGTLVNACAARQHSDQMVCERCGLVWDINDPGPPACSANPLKREEGEAQ